MIAIMNAQNAMAKDATIQDAWLFESKRLEPIDSNVLLIVVIEHAESGQFQNKSAYEFYRARATLTWEPGCHFDVSINSIWVTVCHSTRTVLFGPTHRIQMNPEGRKLGSTLMAQVINWLHEKRLDGYKVVPGMLVGTTVNTPSELIRRNKFYMSFGFTLAGTDGNSENVTGEKVLNGTFSAKTVRRLSVPEKYKGRLQSSTHFQTKLDVERSSVETTVRELERIKAWAKGRTRAAFLKRFILFIMKFPIGRS